MNFFLIILQMDNSDIYRDIAIKIESVDKKFNYALDKLVKWDISEKDVNIPLRQIEVDLLTARINLKKVKQYFGSIPIYVHRYYENTIYSECSDAPVDTDDDSEVELDITLDFELDIINAEQSDLLDYSDKVLNLLDKSIHTDKKYNNILSVLEETLVTLNDYLSIFSSTLAPRIREQRSRTFKLIADIKAIERERDNNKIKNVCNIISTVKHTVMEINLTLNAKLYEMEERISHEFYKEIKLKRLKDLAIDRSSRADDAGYCSTIDRLNRKIWKIKHDYNDIEYILLWIRSELLKIRGIEENMELYSDLKCVLMKLPKLIEMAHEAQINYNLIIDGQPEFSSSYVSDLKQELEDKLQSIKYIKDAILYNTYFEDVKRLDVILEIMEDTIKHLKLPILQVDITIVKKIILELGVKNDYMNRLTDIQKYSSDISNEKLTKPPIPPVASKPKTMEERRVLLGKLGYRIDELSEFTDGMSVERDINKHIMLGAKPIKDRKKIYTGEKYDRHIEHNLHVYEKKLKDIYDSIYELLKETDDLTRKELRELRSSLHTHETYLSEILTQIRGMYIGKPKCVKIVEDKLTVVDALEAELKLLADGKRSDEIYIYNDWATATQKVMLTSICDEINKLQIQTTLDDDHYERVKKQINTFRETILSPPLAIEPCSDEERARDVLLVDIANDTPDANTIEPLIETSPVVSDYYDSDTSADYDSVDSTAYGSL